MIYVELAVGDRPIKPSEQKLDGVRYLFSVRWSARGESWLLTIRSAAGTILLAGLPLRVGQDLLRPHVDVALPGAGRGRLHVLDTSGSGTDPGRDDIGPHPRVRLVYVSDSEVTT